MSRILFSTTPTLEGVTIEKYLGLITTNQVAGTGAFTDLIAQFSDGWGGHSGAYREVMNELKEDVVDRMEKEAIARGGNAVVGVSIDFNNIAAKNMSMFMVSLTGTVVKIKSNAIISESNSANSITAELLECECMKKIIANKIKSGEMVDEDDWKYILSHDMSGIAEELMTLYIKYEDATGYSEESDLCAKYFPQFFSMLSYDIATSLVYQKDKEYYTLIKPNQLFHPAKVLEVLKRDGVPGNTRLLTVNKRSYNADDLKGMKDILAYIDQLPDVGQFTEVKGGLFSTGGMKYVCACGEKNDPSLTYCESCGKDIKGLSMTDRHRINSFKIKAETLEQILH